MLESASGGCLFQGGSAPGGLVLGESGPGESGPGGMSALGRGISQHALRQTPPLWTDRRL